MYFGGVGNGDRGTGGQGGNGGDITGGYGNTDDTGGSTINHKPGQDAGQSVTGLGGKGRPGNQQGSKP